MIFLKKNILFIYLCGTAVNLSHPVRCWTEHALDYAARTQKGKRIRLVSLSHAFW